jgi:hypothetical protein
MLNWNELTIVTTEGSVPNQTKWHPGSAIFPAETCARHIYVGRINDFGDISQELLGHKKTRFYRGIEAYSFFLEFFAGLRSHYHSDKETSGQVRRAWNEYVRKFPNQHKILKPYMDALFCDGSLVKSTILKPFLSRPTLVNTAVKMAGLSTNSRVLVVGGAEDLSTEVITGLGHKKRYTPGKITLTHPSANALNDIVRKIRTLPKYRAIQAHLEPITFDRAFTEEDNVATLFNAQAIFVCQPMTASEQSELGIINSKLCEAWQLRCMVDPDHNAKLIHLKGDPLLRGETTGVWDNLPASNAFISYVTLKQRNGERVDFIKRVTEKAKETIGHLAALRLQGDRVVDISLDTNSGDMPLNYILARRPLGAFARMTDKLDLSGR